MQRTGFLAILAFLPGLMTGCLFHAAEHSAALRAPFDLTAEYRVDPDGLDTPAPRLSWKLAAVDPAAKDLRQGAYQIRAATSLATLGNPDLWDTHRVASDRQLNIAYAGKPLLTSQRVYWQVRAWSDRPGDPPSAWSAPARWTCGVMRPGDWHAKWIGMNPATLRTTTNGVEELVSPAFEKTFVPASKPIAAATLHITGVGYYEASLNGRRIGTKVLDPAPTRYDKRVLYSTYDLTDALRPGTNTLTVLLGHGFFEIRAETSWNTCRAPWRDTPRMIAQLELVYADGSRAEVVSDGTWRQVPNPVGFDCFREGEVIGKGRADGPDPAANVLSAAEVKGPAGRLVAEAQPGAEVVRTLKPVSVKALGSGKWIADFGENMAGWARMELRGQRKGDVVTFRYGERLAADGSLDQKNLAQHLKKTASGAVLAGGGFQTDRLVASGAAVEIYEPRFTSDGFRYVQIEGAARAPDAGTLRACGVRTAFSSAGSFTCSNDLLNKIQLAVRRAYCANFVDGYPTDCPHREKNGWTGDASLAAELAMYNFSNVPAYEKWIRDFLDEQRPDGNIPCLIPTDGWGYDWGNGPAWDSALLVIPWTLYVYAGDRRILEEAYPAMRRYVDYLAGRAKPDGTVDHGLGDWSEWKTETPVVLTSTGYFHLEARILAAAAAALGQTADAEKYAALADRTRAAFNRVLAKGAGAYANGSQTAQASALGQGLVPAGDLGPVRARLVDAVQATKCHPDFGILGSKHVFRELSKAGRTDLAYAMATQEDEPSYGWWIRQGATTFEETWRGNESLDHVMFGDISAWFFQYPGGLRLDPSVSPVAAAPANPDALAFKCFLVAPEPVKGLDWVRVEHESPYGTIRTAWKRVGGAVELEVTVPVNTSATVVPPFGGAPVTIGSGTYHFGGTRR